MKLLCNMKCTVYSVLFILIALSADPTTARSIANRKRMAERELTKEANSDLSADKISTKNPQVDEFVAELANLSIPHYLKDLYLNFTYSNEQIGEVAKANTIRSYQNTAKSKGG